MKNFCLFAAIILLRMHLFEFSLNGQSSAYSLAELHLTESAIKLSIPDVNTGSIFAIGVRKASITGKILTDQPGSIIAAGICWNTKPHPVINDDLIISNTDTGSFCVSLDQLLPGTIYFVRAFAETLRDTIYGEEKVFYTHKTNSIADVDSNYYNIIRIGSQVWLAEDLKTTHLNDGTAILQVAEPSLWGRISTPAYCWYGNDSVTYSFPRGKLYNWYTVGTGKICPVGWHVPTDAEWIALSSFLGGDSISGGHLKSPGTVFWRLPNIGASNSSGFSSFPGGYRNSSGVFLYGTIFNYWWASDETAPKTASDWYVYHAEKALYHQFALKMFGYSVRCIKNE
jgi:uncharacterized protein (TIGR02145 family)